MKKLFYLFTILPFFFFSCSDDDDDITTDYKEVKISIERASNDLTSFNGGDVITIDSDKDNSKYDQKQFDKIYSDENKNILLGKENKVLAAKQEFIVSQKKVKIQLIDSPQLDDEIDNEDNHYALKTTVRIFVDNKQVKEVIFDYSESLANINIVQYAE